MNRKEFIESQGATCLNWQWSWSFINEKEKIIIFGLWDIHLNGLIFSEDWKFRHNGKKTLGYKQSREHIRLIEKEGFQLKTFPMKRASKDDNGTPKIESFEPKLSLNFLIGIGGNWYASDKEIWYASDKEIGSNIPEEVITPEHYFEGTSKKISVNTYERNAEARKKCIQHYGCVCAVCSFNFQKFYGSIGENYIHVHHIVPLSKIKEEYRLDPIKDLIPVCPNCHAIIHKTQPALTIEQLKQHLIDLY
jgi:5-methylcytosine-specific restriction protein A